ncbi:Uncharacterized protein APZ42_013723 [Daphnia magna]|uniref:Pol-like protein n=1 Tax=Daphnia magna TaxID=35525 RepID=A0A162QK44_9CRUS|nr:Uncharacterized protein APZ42_013723 [Daphnia magna]
MCTNCKSLPHEADSEKCPEYLEIKTILKISVIQGISVKDHNRSYSHAVQTSKRNPILLAPSPPPPTDKTTPQLAALQAELKLVRDIAIPCMNESIRNLSLDLAATKKKLSNFDSRFDILEKKQESNAATQIDPGSGKPSPIDLIIASSQFALNSTINLGPYSGSDHLPIITTLNAHPTRLINKLSSRIFDKSKWPQWKSDLDCLLTANSFRDPHTPKLTFDIFQEANMASSYNNFQKPPPAHTPQKNPAAHGGTTNAKQQSAWKKSEAHPLHKHVCSWAWKSAIIIPLLKPGKPANETSSYRTISLTSYPGKLFERMVTNRLNWFLELNNLLGSEQAGFRNNRSTTDHLVKIDHEIKKSFKEKKSTVAVFLDINKACDTVWIHGLLYKLNKIGIHGNCLGWLHNFLLNRSICVQLGGHTSGPKRIHKGVPQGAVISSLLFNIMLHDFPLPPPTINLLLYADDVTIYAPVKHPIDAEIILQPYIEKVTKWGRKWKFKFSASKSTTVTFTQSYKPGDDPLIFLNGNRIPTATKFKFLVVFLDSILLWKHHISHVINNCVRLKNVFSIITKSTYAPPIRSLCQLFKSLVRSRTDYGLIVYGSACKTNLLKIDVICRTILRMILGSRPSTPIEIIYAEMGTESTAERRDWLSTKYTINLSQNPRNLTYLLAKELFEDMKSWPSRCSLNIKSAGLTIKNEEIKLFQYPPGAMDQTVRQPPPWSPAPLNTKWFPMADLHGIRKALAAIYSFDPPAPSIHIFSDSSAIIKAINSNLLPKNRCVAEIRNLLACLRSSGSNTTIYWISSHSGIDGNINADKLASEEAITPGNVIANQLSPDELISITRSSWKNKTLLNLIKCKKK